MIVKNESKQLPRCFSTIKNHIDTWCIVDTGSTDNTIQVIKDELKDIPGHIIKRPWVNFGHNRSESLGFASTKADYLLLCDADEQIIFHKNFDINSLSDHDQFMIKYKGDLAYRVPYLIKSGINWKYVGVTHEFLSSDKDVTRTNLDSISIIDHHDGGSKNDKFDRDIKLLEQGIIEEPNNPRYFFYLANSYKDSNKNLSRAIEMYQKRIDIGGWEEEVTCSYEYKGICQERQGNLTNAIMTWMDGYEFNPKRLECLYNAIRGLRIQGRNKISYQLLQLAKTIPFPKDDILFVKKDIHEHLLDYEETITAFYANPNKDMREIFRNLLMNPKSNYNSIIANYKYYCKDIRQYEIGCIDITYMDNSVLQGYTQSSPCIIKVNDGYLVNVRNVSYFINRNDGSYGEIEPGLSKGKINTRNTCIQLDKDFNVIGEKHFFENDNSIAVNGIEDLKLIEHNDTINFTGTKWKDYGKINIVTGRYDLMIKDYLEYKDCVSPTHRSIEKNWVPFIHEDSIKYVYDWNPIMIGTIANDKMNIVKSSSTFLPGFRGSSPGFEYKDEIYFLTHAVEYSTPRHYYHSIVVLDKKTLEYKRHSNLFTFDGQKIEYALGLIIEDDRVIISHSSWDSNAKIKVYNKEKLFANVFS